MRATSRRSGEGLGKNSGVSCLQPLQCNGTGGRISVTCDTEPSAAGHTRLCGLLTRGRAVRDDIIVIFAL